MQYSKTLALTCLSLSSLAAAYQEAHFAERDLYARDPYAYADAEPYYSEHELYARDAHPDPYAYADPDPYFEEDHHLYARHAEADPYPYADPEPYFEDEHDLYARDADPEAYFDDDYAHDLYARDAYADADADAYYADHDLYARDADADAYPAPEAYIPQPGIQARDPMFGMRRKGYGGKCAPRGWHGKLICVGDHGGAVFPKTPCRRSGAYCNSEI